MEQVESRETDRLSQHRKVDGEDLRHVPGELVHLLVRVFNTATTSDESDSLAFKRVREEFFGKLSVFLKEAPGLLLEVQPFELLWQEEPLYEDREPEGLPNVLCRGGIRELGFNRGITDREITGFFNVLKGARRPRAETGDLFVMLHDGDFPHLDCVGGDDYFEAHPLPIPGNLGDLRRQYLRSSVPPVQRSRIFREHCPGSEIEFLEPLPRERPLKINKFTDASRFCPATPDEMEAINREIVDESSPAFGRHSLEVLIEVLLMEKSEKDFDQIITFIVKMLDEAISVGDYSVAPEVVKSLYRGFRVASIDDWQKKRIKKAIFDAGAESRIGAIAESIRSSERPDLDGLAKYVCLLQRNAVPHLCKLLGELKGSKPRRIICDALADMGKNSVEVFGAFLDDERWYVARNIVYILGRIAKPECLPYLENALDHPDPRVRREAVQAISTVADREAAIQHLTRKLNDMDSKIRGIAALRLARIGGEEALRPLLDLVLSKPFQKREVHEMKLFIQALGILGSDGAVPALFGILLKKSLFGKIKTDEIRKSVADALGAIGTNESISALRKISTMGDDLAKEASLAVLRRIEQ